MTVVPQVRGQPLFCPQADLAQRSGQEEPTAHSHPLLFPQWSVSEAAARRRLGTWVPPGLGRKLRAAVASYHQSNQVRASRVSQPCLLLSITPHTEDTNYTGTCCPRGQLAPGYPSTLTGRPGLSRSTVHVHRRCIWRTF